MNIKQINFARKHAAYCNYYRNFAASKKEGVLNKRVSPWITYPGLAAAGYGAYKADPYLADAAAGWANTDSAFPRTTLSPSFNFPKNMVNNWGNGPYKAAQYAGSGMPVTEVNSATGNIEMDPTTVHGSLIGGGPGQLDLSQFQTPPYSGPLLSQGVDLVNQVQG